MKRYTSLPKYVWTHPNGRVIPYARLSITNDSLFWSLMPWHIDSVADAFRREYPESPPRKISDRTAHVGVDMLHLSRLFPGAMMEGYEKCPDTFCLLEDNVKRLALDCKKWTLKCGCGAQDGPDAETDLVYLDPNWGGSDYKSKSAMELYLGDTSVSDLIVAWLDKGKKGLKICLKAPINWDGHQKLQDRQNIKYRIYRVLNGQRLSYNLFFFFKEQ